MKKFLLIFCYFLSFLAVGGYSNKRVNLESCEYAVKISSDAKRVAYIEARIILTDSLLYMSDEGPTPERWDDYVQNLKIKTLDGKNIPVKKTENHWKVLSFSTQKVILTYEIILKHDESEWAGGIDGVAYANEWGVFYTGRSLFIMNGKNRNNILVKFLIPNYWKVSTPWVLQISKTNTYKVKNLADLTESLIYIGLQKEFELKKEGLDILFVLGGDSIIAQKDKFQSIANQIMEYYISKLGGLPKPNPKEPLSKMLVVINSSNEVDGEVIGNHISMFINPNGDQQTQLVAWFMFAHEFFHLWNGKSIRSADSRDDWFKEGFSNYYTLKALYSAGFVNDKAIEKLISRLFYSRYMNDQALGKKSVLEVTEGFDKDNHWGMIYGGGLFVAISQDIIIRKNSNNNKSLDDLMRFLYQEYGGKEKFYSTNDIILALNELTGENQQVFFNKYIFGTEIIPIHEYLQFFGFDVNIENNTFSMKPKSNLTEFEKISMQGFYGK